jgi:hypothetical protein
MELCFGFLQAILGMVELDECVARFLKFGFPLSEKALLDI